MSKRKLFNIKTLISFILTLLITFSTIVIMACPDLEKDIKNDLSKYIKYLNNGEISGYYDIYNTRKLNDIEKSLFYEKIKNTTKIVNEQKETFEKFKLKVKINDVNILKKMNNNLYLCNINTTYHIRENIHTTKTIKKTEEHIVKVIYVGQDGYKILLPFNSMDKDFSQTETFMFLEQEYKNNKAKEIEEKRLLEESQKEDSQDDAMSDEEIDDFIDEQGLNSEIKENNDDTNSDDESVEESDDNENSDNNINDNNNIDEKSESNNEIN